jgi:hypothetical protein
MFLYWGRRGPGTQLAYELQREALLSENVRPTLSISRQNEYFETFRAFGDSVLAIDTFSRGFGAATGLWRVPFLASTLAERIKADRIDAVVSLTPHLWTPFVMPALRRAGAVYVKIVHNAAAHPGDATGIVSDLTLFETRHADLVVTLSNTVKELISDRAGSARTRSRRTN